MGGGTLHNSGHGLALWHVFDMSFLGKVHGKREKLRKKPRIWNTTEIFIKTTIIHWWCTKAPVTHSRFWLRLITIRPDETYIVKSGCVGMVKTENSEIPTMSHDVPTVSLRLLYDSWRCYYDATTMLLRQSHDITVGQSYCILGESGWIWMSRGESCCQMIPRLTPNAQEWWRILPRCH